MHRPGDPLVADMVDIVVDGLADVVVFRGRDVGVSRVGDVGDVGVVGRGFRLRLNALIHAEPLRGTYSSCWTSFLAVGKS